LQIGHRSHQERNNNNVWEESEKHGTLTNITLSHHNLIA